MNLKYERNREYIEENGLDKLINFFENSDYKEGVFDSVSGEMTIPIPPDADDLVRLHKLVRNRRPWTILEFGIGYSTIIMADALAKNEKEWGALKEKPKIRNRYMFGLFSVDSSKKWIVNMLGKFPEGLEKRVYFKHSRVRMERFGFQVCHCYEQIPNIIADFIYLDGPDPKTVEGGINGLSFNCDERTVMSGDLLLMESTFLPGTFIIVDGRTNNARFLERNFTRNYEVIHDKEADITTFELKEERLGKYNVLGSDFF